MPARRPEREAERLLARAGITAPPIAVDSLVKIAGAKLSTASLPDSISGLLYRDAENTVVGVNDSQAPTRQRFTIAHELAHLTMHAGRPLVVDASIRVNWRDNDSAAATEREEIEANAFAAALLMPAVMVHRELETLLSDRERAALPPDDIVKRLAKRFEVSTQAMNYRLIGLGLQLSS